MCNTWKNALLFVWQINFNGVETFREKFPVTAAATASAHTHYKQCRASVFICAPRLLDSATCFISFYFFYDCFFLPIRLIPHLFTFHFVRCQFVYSVQWAQVSPPAFSRRSNKHIALTNWLLRLRVRNTIFDERRLIKHSMAFPYYYTTHTQHSMYVSWKCLRRIITIFRFYLPRQREREKKLFVFYYILMLTVDSWRNGITFAKWPENKMQDSSIMTR